MKAVVVMCSAAGRRARLHPGVFAAIVVVVLSLLAHVLASCGLEGGPDDVAGRDVQARRLAVVRQEFAGAADALVAGDREGFLRRLPGRATTSSARARRGLGEVFDTLSRLPWRSFDFSVTQLDAAAGIYRVVGAGQLGDSGPSDRLAVVRYLELVDTAGGELIAGDRTPEDLRRRYLMALHEPVALQRPGVIVLADRWARGRARTVLEAAVRARPRLSALGLDVDPTVVITVYGSAEDVRDALAVDASTTRLVYFSYPTLRVAKDHWDVYDVGVMGPWLRDPGVSTDAVLAHELTHAYTARWFAGDESPSSLLQEGVAEAAEGMPVTTPALRDEVASGDQLWPLPESFAVRDVWDGADAEAVGLGYDVGGSLVQYVVSRWGASRLRAFVQAVDAAEPTEDGMDAALGRALGVDWREFYAGWRRYVLRGGWN